MNNIFLLIFSVDMNEILSPYLLYVSINFDSIIAGVDPREERQFLSLQLLPLRHDAPARSCRPHEERARSHCKVPPTF